MRSMKNLSANMDLRNLRINGLAKAIIMNDEYSFFHPDKSGGNSDCSFENGGNSRLGDALIATGFSLWNDNDVSVSGFSQSDILQDFFMEDSLAKAIHRNDNYSFFSPDKSWGYSECPDKSGGNSYFPTAKAVGYSDWEHALIATGFSLWNDNDVSVSGFSQSDILQDFFMEDSLAKAIIMNDDYSFVPPDKSGGNSDYGDSLAKAINMNDEYSFVPPDKSGGNSYFPTAKAVGYSGWEHSLIATGFSLWNNDNVSVSGFSQKNNLQVFFMEDSLAKAIHMNDNFYHIHFPTAEAVGYSKYRVCAGGNTFIENGACQRDLLKQLKTILT